MRPRRLELTAFGPFADREVVDFDALAGAGLFLVTGPTGAGKTSLLDGLCYALYGRVPGGRRPDRLRSDHAPPDRDTEVALEFSARDADWRVTRRPPQERARQRGPGTITHKPTATLARRDGERWEPVCAGVEEVGGAVLGITGLDAEQFAQVVVLPQGEVQRALRSDARERERLLSSLFDTGRFAAFADRLGERARKLAERAARRAERLEGLRAEAALRWREVAKEADLDDLDEPPLDQAALDDLVVRAGRAAAAVAAETAAVRAIAGSAALRLREGERLADLQARGCRAAERLAELDAEAAELAELAARTRRGEAAASLRPLLAELARTGDALAAAERACSTALADPALPRTARDLDDLLQRTRADRTRVEALAPRAAVARRARAEAEAARLEVLAHNAAGERARLAADECARQADEAGEALARARESATALPGLSAGAERLRAAATAAGRLVPLERCWIAAREGAAEEREVANRAAQAHLALLRRSLEGMAGRLARDLRPGTPCQVCGAREHPHPAEWADPVTDQQVDRAEREAAERARVADAAREDRDAALRELEVARCAAGDAAVDPDAAVRAAEQADRALTACRALVATAAPLAGELAELRRRETSHRDDADRASAHATRARARQVAAAARAEADESAVAEVAGGVDPEEAAARLAGRETLVAAAAAALATRERAAREADAARERAGTAATGQGFADAADAADALLDDRELARLSATVDDHGHARRVAAATLAEPEVAHATGLPLVDVAGLDAAADAARRAADSGVERQATVSRAAAELVTIARAAAAEETALAPLRSEADRVRALAEVCRGTGNDRRMSLERFVLAAVLEDVAARASLRLAAMTDGRFTLRHSDERARGGGASGLAILVRDAFTGTERDVATLSGGETFQASLALALGIADAVAGTGAVPLSTLFVDEGFGALDPDALEEALTELDRLREGGRLVGVISHVAALRERIPAGLHVERTRAGSRVRAA